MALLLARWTWFLLYLCALYGLGLFMVSFFPTKPIVPRVYDDELAKGPPASFDRLVLLVIDSLRADFLIEEQRMNYTRSLIRQGDAIAYVAEAVVPTVTMPRLKALTSGTIPVFMDVAFNFDASSAFQDDNFVDRLKEAKRSVVFYGDDTWLKLFPTQFDRSEGVSSFFVADTREVDDNVTRRLLPDLDKSDWSALIGHLLGLDHAGHLTGPHSPLTNSKKVEVDELVRTVYTRLYSNPIHERTLFVLASDHGMNERGNHGGADQGEVSSLLVFISPRYKHGHTASTDGSLPHLRAAQVDLAPTLSLLLGLPIPRTSVGRSLLAPLSLLSTGERLQALDANAEQLHKTFDDVCDDAALRERLHKLFIAAKDARTSNSADEAIGKYEAYLNQVNGALKEQLTRFDLPSIYAGLALLAMSAAAMLLLSIGGPHVSFRGGDYLTGLWACLLMYIYTHYSYPRIDPFVLAGVAFTGSVLYQFNVHWHGFWRSFLTRWDVLVLAVELGKQVLLLSSSFVEEEHQTAFIIALTFAFADLCVAYARGSRSLLYSAVFWIIFLRVGRSWNRSGNKWLAEMDVAKYLIAAPTELLHAQSIAAVACVYALSVISFRQSRARRRTWLIVSTHVWAAAVAVLKTQLIAPPFAPVWLARIGYFASAYALVASALPLRTALDRLPLLVLAALQFMFVVHRAQNLGLLALLGVAALWTVPDLKLPVHLSRRPVGWVASLCSLLWLGQAAVFSFGNTNSLATIDIGAAYTGLSGYVPVAVALLIFVLMYSGHLLLVPAFVGRIRLIALYYPYMSPVRIPFLLMGLKLVALAFYALVLVAMRHHLFVWSVFAPRLLYVLIDLAWETLRSVTLLCALPTEPARGYTREGSPRKLR